jgi:hypothetical protein
MAAWWNPHLALPLSLPLFSSAKERCKWCSATKGGGAVLLAVSRVLPGCRSCYRRWPVLLPTASGVATNGGRLATMGTRSCSHRRAGLLPWVHGVALTGGRGCYHGWTALLPSAGGLATMGVRCCCRRRAACTVLLPSASGLATMGLWRCCGWRVILRPGLARAGRRSAIRGHSGGFWERESVDRGGDCATFLLQGEDEFFLVRECPSGWSG